MQTDPAPGSGNAEVTTISELTVMNPYVRDINQVVSKLLLEERNGPPMCYSLVDGNNVIEELQGGELALRSVLIDEAIKCLPPETKSQVIVVWPQSKWDALGTNGNTAERLANLFAPLRQGASVYFALVDYPTANLVREEGTVFLPNGAEKDQWWCKLPGMRKADHLACELDDAILTELHCAITKNNRCAIAVTGDRRVIKTREELVKLKGWVEAARRQGWVQAGRRHSFYVITTFMKVTTVEPDADAGLAAFLTGTDPRPDGV